MKSGHVIALFLLLTLPQALADGLPDLGEVAQATFSPQAERKLGEAIMAEIRRDRSLLDDELTEYLNNLGYRLVAASPESRQSFEFFVIQDNSVNAFALPGGFIGVHTGLLLTAQSESELAAVLGHEIAHVTQRHLARMIDKEKQSMMTSLAAMAIAILASRSNPQLSSAAIATAQASSIQNTLNFTREHEREADRVLQILPGGFDPHRRNPRKAAKGYPPLRCARLSAYPSGNERIADIRIAWRASRQQTADNPDFFVAPVCAHWTTRRHRRQPFSRARYARKNMR
jgi:predicted Zn-dependent protease